jgi:acetolactate synthase I/II/III large subunit
MKLKGAEILIRLLERQGVEIMAGIPGGANLPIYDALYGSSIRHILARHEQGAGFIAQGMARSTGKPAVCLATSGPGATNLVTAVADAKLDSVPLIAITGQVATSMIGTDAFQEVDTYGMTLNITKHNYLVKQAEDLLRIIPEAFAIAAGGRPGPVLIDIPKDVQLAVIDVDRWPEPGQPLPAVHGDPALITEISRMINGAKRPVIYAGGGIISAGASLLLQALARKNSIPVAVTLMGLGTFPPDDPLYLGMLGMHGAPHTNYVLDEADLLLAIGVRFDDRAIGKVQEFCPKAAIVHIDVDDSEIDKIKASRRALRADAGLALEALLPRIETNARQGWIRRVEKIKQAHPAYQAPPEDVLHPFNLIKAVASIAGEDTIVTTDVGQHQMWVAQAYPFRHPRTFLTSGGLGTMGFGLPAAIGAALANPHKKVICISGDGSIQMNIQELATLVDLGLNVSILIMNNQHLGLVRQQQELFFGGNYIASHFPRRLDFAAIGRDFGVEGVNLETEGDLTAALRRMIGKDGPSITDIPIRYAENVYPMVPPGAPNREMLGPAGILRLMAKGEDCGAAEESR